MSRTDSALDAHTANGTELITSALIAREISYLLDIVIGESTVVLKLLSSKDQALLVGGNSLLVLNLGLDIINGV